MGTWVILSHSIWLRQGVSRLSGTGHLPRQRDLSVPIAQTPDDLIGRVDVIILNFFDSDAVESVMAGPDGLFSGNCTGKIIYRYHDKPFRTGPCNSIPMAREHGAIYLECPVLRSVVPASQGNLTVIVSGDSEPMNP